MANLLAFRILDCTFRDGGYKNNWQWSDQQAFDYCQMINKLPVSYVEMGYRLFQDEGQGKYRAVTQSMVDLWREYLDPNRGIAIMVDTREFVDPRSIYVHLEHIWEKVDLVRFTVECGNNLEADVVTDAIKDLKRLDSTTQVAINIMMSQRMLVHGQGYLDHFMGWDSPDMLYIVDTAGCMLPHEVKFLVDRTKRIIGLGTSIGFHGHNNLGLALMNSEAAVDAGATYIDTTISGQGHGAGNLPLEHLLGYKMKLNRRHFYADLRTIPGDMAQHVRRALDQERQQD